MADLLRLGPEVDSVVVHSSCTKRKDGDGRREAEECNSDITCYVGPVDSSLQSVCRSDLVLGKEISNFPAFDLQSLIRVNESRHSGLLVNGIVVIYAGFG
jgi:hypothetical protein